MQKIIRPQPGPQEKFLETKADIAIYGGAAGGGKTYGLLLEPIRHINNPKFKGLIFRRVTPQILKPGALWDQSQDIYYDLKGVPVQHYLRWTFPSGMKIEFSHLQYEANVHDYQGAQIPYIGFDELCHFTEKQFFYMLGRNRSDADVPGYIRATCNPDPNSWVKKFIAWWLNEKTGFAIPERSGKIRWFVRDQGRFVWASKPSAFGVKAKFAKSVTFIPSKVYDNKILLAQNPGYLANLEAMAKIDRDQLLDGNWNVVAAAGLLFKRQWFEISNVVPISFVKVVRYWDRAATQKIENTDLALGNKKNNPDFTVGLKLGITYEGLIYVLDIVRFQESPFKVLKGIQNTASRDGVEVEIGLEQEPGASGKAEVEYIIRHLQGYAVKCYPARVNKIIRSKPISAQSEMGHVKLIRAEWNDTLLNELENFPDGANDDQVDTLSGGYTMLAEASGSIPTVTNI